MYQAEKHQPARMKLTEGASRTERLPSANDVQLVSVIHDRQAGSKFHWIEARILMGEVYLSLVASPWKHDKLMVRHISPDPRLSFPMIEGHEVLNDPWISKILEIPSADEAARQLIDYFVVDIMSLQPVPFQGNAAVVRAFLENLSTASGRSIVIKAPWKDGPATYTTETHYGVTRRVGPGIADRHRNPIPDPIAKALNLNGVEVRPSKHKRVIGPVGFGAKPRNNTMTGRLQAIRNLENMAVETLNCDPVLISEFVNQI